MSAAAACAISTALFSFTGGCDAACTSVLFVAWDASCIVAFVAQAVGQLLRPCQPTGLTTAKTNVAAWRCMRVFKLTTGAQLPQATHVRWQHDALLLLAGSYLADPSLAMQPSMLPLAPAALRSTRARQPLLARAALRDMQPCTAAAPGCCLLQPLLLMLLLHHVSRKLAAISSSSAISGATLNSGMLRVVLCVSQQHRARHQRRRAAAGLLLACQAAASASPHATHEFWYRSL